MRIVAAIVALCAAAFLAVAAWHRRKKDPRLPSQGAVGWAVILLMLSTMVALARPSPYPPVTQFVGDRYAAHAQMGPEVAREAQRQRAAKKLNRRATAAQRRGRHVPAPVPRPRNAAPPASSEPYRVNAPLSIREGIQREAASAAGRPASWCGWWLGQHLGMPLRKLWLARNWAHVGSPASPGVGVVVVWAHHVGIITGRSGNQWVVKSGNDGRRVRERPRSVAGAIAFRRVS